MILASRELPDGREVSLVEMIFNVRLCVGWPDEDAYDRAWCYPKLEYPAALVAVAEWDGVGDPPGPWIKEAGTERRRTQGAERTSDW